MPQDRSRAILVGFGKSARAASVLELVGQATHRGLEPGVVHRGIEGAGARRRHRVAIGVGAGPRMIAPTTSPDASVSTATTWMAAPRPIASATRPESSAPTA